MKEFPKLDNYASVSSPLVDTKGQDPVSTLPTAANRTDRPVTISTFTGNDTVGSEAVSFILRTTLLPHHHEDPNVLKFISSYVRCRDVKQASSEAGIHPATGHKLRNRADIHTAITKITEAAMMKYGFDAEEIVEKVKEIAYVDPLEFENEDGSFKRHLRDISPEARRAIKKFKAKNIYETDPNGMRVHVGELIEVEFWDKMKGIEMLGREKSLFKETKKVEHDVTGDMKNILLQSAERAEAAALEARKEREVNTIDITAKDANETK